MAEDGPEVLVAEDDDEIRHLIRVGLESAGCRPELARDGLEALAASDAGGSTDWCSTSACRT